MTKIYIAEDHLPRGAVPAYDRAPGRPQPVFNWDIRKWRSQRFNSHRKNNWSVAPNNVGDKSYIISCIADAYLRLLERRQSGTLLISWWQSAILKYCVALTFFPDELDRSGSCKMPDWFPVNELTKESALLLSVIHA